MTWSYVPPLRDMQFVLDEMLTVGDDWAQMTRFADLSPDMTAQILAAAGQFAAQTLAPTNAEGDQAGCVYEAGRVRVPAAFAAAYRQFCEAGWPALACDAEFGGQGLPQLLNTALYEMLNSANHAWSMYPGIVHGAYECLRAHAAPWIKSRYLPKIVSGEWLCTMCLTEPQAGSDVGLARTRAEPRPDGSYSISGTKIFISGGEHDLTQNIVHLVLARLPGAPDGSRGISLFMVPKVIPGEQGSSPNSLRCDGVEKKMGIKGSATCVMAFDGAQGWLLGEPHRGLAAMFIMMNAARLLVGMQGLGHAEMAWQNARRQADGRLQMRAPERPAGTAATAGGADPISYQPAVRKTLMTLRCLVEGQRALGYWSAHLLDIGADHPDESRRTAANDLLSLLTPVVKSFFTENGFQLTSAALQLWGGYGYTRDYGIEQAVRDSRISMIYEGTNEIQAADFLVRKVIGDGGRRFEALLRWVLDEAAACETLTACRPFGRALSAMATRWHTLTGAIIREAAAQPAIAHGIATDHLRVAGLCLLGACWARAARLSTPRAGEPFYRDKLEAAQFYFDYLLPEASWRLDLIERRHAPLPWIRAAD